MSIKTVHICDLCGTVFSPVTDNYYTCEDANESDTQHFHYGCFKKMLRTARESTKKRAEKGAGNAEME